MNIKFGNEQYKTLVDVFYIADWVLHAHHSSKEKPPETKAFRKLEQKIYKSGYKFGFKDLFETIKNNDGTKYCPNRKVEEENHEFIEKFEVDTFWSELLDRLSDRDVLNSTTQKEREEMDINKYWKLKAIFEEKYDAEFNDCGIERLHIKK